MKSVLRSAAAIAALSGVCEGTHAASSLDEIEQIRSQLQGVTERMDRLEQENNALKAENESLKAHDEYLRAETRGLRKDAATQASEVGKIKGADWAAKTAIKGDMRYRYEMISDDTVNGAGVATADRYRDRIRARVNIEANPAETLRVGVGLTTTENNDPRSGNQTLTDVFSRKSVDLDLAYFDWRFAPWGELIGGKMKQPFYKQQQSGFWDNDVNPEGLALAFNRGAFFGSLYNFWVKEVSGLENTLT
ncbi:MAG TPA: putative porin, partial [Steroidobacter sp.]|nr:putative porin [Steroidobacter sp.]